MVAISVRVDVDAALLAGHQLGDYATIDVSHETLGSELWRSMVLDLQMQQTPPALSTIAIAAPTVEAVRDALAENYTARAAEGTKALEAFRSGVALLRTVVEMAPPIQKTRGVFEFYRGVDVSRHSLYVGFERVLPHVAVYLPPRAILSAEQRTEWEALIAERNRLIAQSTTEVDTLNQAAVTAALNSLRAALANEQRGGTTP